MVIDAEGLGDQRFEFADLSLGLQLELLPRSELVARGDPDHVAVLALVEAAGLQNDVERLVPGHILEAQGQTSVDRVAGDDVEVGEIGDHLQHRSHVDVLEVERQLFAVVAGALALHQLARILDDFLDLQHELVVALIGVVLPQPLRADRHAHRIALFLGRDLGHRRAEVGHVEATAQRLRQGRLEKLDDQIRAHPPDVDGGFRRRQFDHHAPFAIDTAAERDVANGAVGGSRTAVGRGGEGRIDAGLGRADIGAAARQRDEDEATFGARVVGHGAIEVEHQPRAVTDLHDVGAAQIAGVEPLDRCAEAVAGPMEIECDPRRGHDAEARRRHAHGLGHRQAQDHLTALVVDVDRLDAVALDRRCRIRRVSRRDRDIRCADADRQTRGQCQQGLA